MSKKDKTTGEEFENFMSFAMQYNFKKKSKKKNYYRPSEIREIYRQNNMTDEMMYKCLIALGVNEKEAQMMIQKILHPTSQDLELEKTIRDEDLYLD